MNGAGNIDISEASLERHESEGTVFKIVVFTDDGHYSYRFGGLAGPADGEGHAATPYMLGKAVEAYFNNHLPAIQQLRNIHALMEGVTESEVDQAVTAITWRCPVHGKDSK